MPCCHQSLHWGCLSTWIDTRWRGVVPRCPLCRGKVIPIPGYAEEQLSVGEVELMNKELLFLPLAAQEAVIERGMEESLRFFRIFKTIVKRNPSPLIIADG